MNEYLLSIMPEKTDMLKELREYAEAHNVPILRTDAARLIETLVSKAFTDGKGPVFKVLEAGTAIGYSSILMANAMKACGGDSDFYIETAELDLDTAVSARKNIEKAGFSEKIRVICGDAAEIFSCIKGNEIYDFIFIDSAKSEYPVMYDDIKRLLKKGGMLVCDNVVYYGKIFETPQNSPHKHRTIIGNLRSFLERLSSDSDYITSIVETGDGMAIAVKKGI